MVEGTVLRSHAGGYLVYIKDQDAVFQCAARGRLKKERVSIVTGDRVELDELDLEQKTAVIASLVERQNILSRPPLANVDQVVIVQAFHQPEWNALLCDRYLVHFQLELPSAPPVLCFNKCDLAQDEELSALRRIYEPLGYSVIIVSAKAGIGMDELAFQLAGKVSVLTGPSGVGKSSILNFLEPSLDLRVGIMENEFGVGRHTTTYSELYRIGAADRCAPPEANASWVADTPGFNILELRHPEPRDVVFQFPEILTLAHDCHFTNCLHTVEHGCNVLEHAETVAPSRFASYSAVVGEAQDEQRLRKESSHKVESSVKVVGGAGKGKNVPRLSGKYRAESRRNTRQNLRGAAIMDDEDGDDDSSPDEQSDENL